MILMLPAAAGLLLASAAADPAPVEERHVMIPMRDGVKLSTYLFLPRNQGPGPWPVLYEQRYASVRSPAYRRNYARLAAAGYVVAAQNFRGTHLSEGVFDGYRNLAWGDRRDGYDTVEWLAAQPWSTGRIGTFGGSQAGYAQNFLAVTRPPHLVAQYMTDTGLSLFHLGYRRGGTTRPRRFLSMLEHCQRPEDALRWLRDTFDHPTYDEYWQQEDCTRHFDKMNVPAFTLGSWFDFMNDGSVESYIGRQHRGGPGSRGRQQLLIGPWLHGGPKGARVGDLTFPENAAFDYWAHMIRWFDYHLKGKATGVDRDPPVRYYVMGENIWREARDWPPPSTPTPYYLEAGGGLSARPPAAPEGATLFRSDPDSPAPIPGRAFPGATDGRAYEQHPDVKSFTTPALTKPVEWSGKLKAELYLSSDARDTDIIVRVNDVHPDGRSILLLDGIFRTRYREGFEKEVLLDPGVVVPLRFDLGWLSQVFPAGHRIRITVSSTGADLYEPNPNTGDPAVIGPPPRVFAATNSIHHNRRHASRIIAPVR